ncbi:CHAT domain-containing protein [Telluribacter sp. SYSU D00476]|uniref:CHAT domain-containing protein n=1 Tax=Telluribacter sp. SYSU D00476 TaxID=2811430 RepID=UPI001FF6D93F|nr:CHAT domain-containing protein [Telluribacter sp. SYSU D00476]
MRTITLELLRHGPAHNQLLSPLTPYMALCENHSSVTLHIPFEHYQFLHRLSGLRYGVDETARGFQLTDTARIVGEILGMIPGLTAESNKSDSTDERLTHLRLILSASELALLPFELAQAPNGLPGSGQHLLLQPQMPICLTREIRRTGDDPFAWPLAPRILFVAASPPVVGIIPYEMHLQALRKLIAPWVKYHNKSDLNVDNSRIEEHLVVLKDASIEAIEQACASNAQKPFTHIHILAHGVERNEVYDTRFYLALHGVQDPNEVDYISGPRLAAALRAALRPESNPLARPAVVSLASCDSANGGSVVGAGASIAHALHEAGIPLVVASQFPLSFAGSVRLVECLYEGLLWGTDPRLLLYDLRRRLYAQFPNTHDWASLTAYVSLPAEFNQQLPEIQIEQAMRSINAAMNHADEATRHLSKKIKDKRSIESQESPPESIQSLLQEARDRINDAKKRLERLLLRWPKHRARICGLLASTEKRQAEILFSASRNPNVNSNALRDRKESFELLRKSRNHYWDAFLADRSKSWAAVQYLSLTIVMSLSSEFPESQFVEQTGANFPEFKDFDQPDKKVGALWTMTQLLSSYDLHSEDRQSTIWAHGNLIELYLLSKVIPSLFQVSENAAQLSQDHTDALINISGRKSFAVYSTRRQILRYVEWYSEFCDIQPVAQLAEQVFDRFPEEAEEAWK